MKEDERRNRTKQTENADAKKRRTRADFEERKKETISFEDAGWGS